MLHGRCDSVVVETDVNLLWDAMRCLIRVSNECGLDDWRQWIRLTEQWCFLKETPLPSREPPLKGLPVNRNLDFRHFTLLK
ncbi:MAG: hypothetical protein OXH65_03820 [Paracoccaceae bacterium]|nr:hypothetical protein [Paracoccaceae bacterium]MDE2674215.1 hypothetical protein [Paracoccaceae bacterium]